MQLEQVVSPVLGALNPVTTMGFDFVAPPGLRGEVRVVSFTGREAMSDLFSFDILLSSPFLQQESSELEAKLLGQPAALVLHAVEQSTRVVPGIVASFDLEGAIERTGEPCVRVRLVPRLWLTTQRRRSRIFQEMTVPAIVDAVLGQWQVAHA